MFAQCFCKKPSKVSLQKILYISLQSIFFDVATQHQKKMVFWLALWANQKTKLNIFNLDTLSTYFDYIISFYHP